MSIETVNKPITSKIRECIADMRKIERLYSPDAFRRYILHLGIKGSELPPFIAFKSDADGLFNKANSLLGNSERDDWEWDNNNPEYHLYKAILIDIIEREPKTAEDVLILQYANTYRKARDTRKSLELFLDPAEEASSGNLLENTITKLTQSFRNLFARPSSKKTGKRAT